MQASELVLLSVSCRMREWPEFAEVTCLAIACPSCMTLDLARSCSTYVTTIINGADLIPTVSAGHHHSLSYCASILSVRVSVCLCAELISSHN